MQNIPENQTNDVVIQLKGISKAYGLYPSPLSRVKEALHPFKKKYHKAFYALKEIGFEVRRGEILGIVGKNGSGKSTLLKIISNILHPTSGVVYVKGDIAALLELGSTFNPEFNGLENIYFHGSILGFNKEYIDQKLDDILSFADIGDFIHQPLRTYSSGMKVRLAFAISTTINPDILILDEVLAVGDELFRRKCYSRMEQIIRSDKTILFVSHSAQSIIELCTRAILIDRGELLLEGSPKLVISHYQRFLYSRPEKTPKIREEIKHLNQDEELKRKYEAQVTDQNEAKNKEQNQICIEEVEARDTTPPKKGLLKPYFVENFLPKTTLEYKNYDLDIYDIQMKTLSGEKVNMLVMDDEYFYCYKVRFNKDMENIKFSTSLKTEKGLDIGCARVSGEYNLLEQVKKGEEYNVEWHFRCILLPGTYFTNIGVTSYANGKRDLLNRIVDASAFKVQDITGRNFGGLVHLGQQAIITKIK